MSGSRGETASPPLQNLALMKEKVAGLSMQEKATSGSLQNRQIADKNMPADGGMEIAGQEIEAKPPTLGETGDTRLSSKSELLLSAGEIADLVKDGRFAKSVESAKALAVDSRKPQSLQDQAHEDDEAALDTDHPETGGVSQLLALLGSPEGVPTAASSEVPTTPTELISEFQALADRAGADRAGEGTQRQPADRGCHYTASDRNRS